MSAPTESAIGLQIAVEAALSMPQRGVKAPHVIPASLILVGLGLMEQVTSPTAMATWLYRLADEYAAHVSPKDEVVISE